MKRDSVELQIPVFVDNELPANRYGKLQMQFECAPVPHDHLNPGERFEAIFRLQPVLPEMDWEKFAEKIVEAISDS